MEALAPSRKIDVKINTESPAENPLLARGSEQWQDWRWQQRNAITSLVQIEQIFPDLDPGVLLAMQPNLNERKLTITPYTMSLVATEAGKKSPRLDDPIWQQLLPLWDKDAKSEFEYNGQTENWELPEEMVTPICQHKYPNRVILRISNVCHAYCQFCYEALRTLEHDSDKEAMKASLWNDTVNYVRNNAAVEEVILSGGEPLMLSDKKIDALLASLRGVPRDLSLRIHTRALTFNPFRITDELLETIKRHQVSAIGLHVCTLSEITPEFIAAAKRLQTACPILFANIPLLAGINDNVETMRELCMRLYRIGIVPHYLYHFMPFSPGISKFRTPVQKGIEIVAALKRTITNIAVPEFVLPHATGKYTVPIMKAEQDFPVWINEGDNGRVVRYKNWKNQEIHYPDYA